MPVLGCDCVAAGEITVKSAAASSTNHFKPSVPMPWFSRTTGVAFQEERYGHNQRLHNVSGKKGESLTCTVCGRVKN